MSKDLLPGPQITLFYEPGVRSTFPDGIEDAKDQFVEWLGKRHPDERAMVTRNGKLLFIHQRPQSYRVQLVQPPPD